MQAVESANKLIQEEKHLDELGMSTLVACFVNANRDPKKGEPAKPSDFFNFSRDRFNEVSIPTVAADAFFSLVKDKKMPGWVIPIAPIEKLTRSRTGLNAPKFRTLVADGAIIFAPVEKAGSIHAPLAIISEVSGVVKFHNPDTKEIYLLRIPAQEFANAWVLDSDFEVLDYE